MRIYLGQNSPDQNYKHFQNLPVFNREVMDSEANEIVCDGFLRTFAFEEIPQVLSVICKKLRLNGRLVIKDMDISLVSKHIFRYEADVASLNKVIMGAAMKSFMKLEDVESCIPSTVSVSSKHFEEGMCHFIVEGRRQK